MLLVSTVFTSLVTFLSSTYALKKRTVMSLATAVLGAAVNIALNIILIPKYEAFGAAFATMVCYVIVFVVRSINVRGYVKFRMYTLPFILSSLILGVQCAFATVGAEYDLHVQALFFLGVFLANLPVMIGTVKMIFSKN